VPVNYTFGFQYHSPWGDLSLDNQLINGNYGGKSTKDMKFHLIRAGWELPLANHFIARCSSIIPLKLSTSSLGNLSLPYPGFDLTLGAGYLWKNIAIDAAIFGDPGKSYVQQKAKIGSMISVSFKY